MMCFPKLKQCFCCCSLRTGVLFICWISLFCNLFFLCYLHKSGSPVILSFLDETKLVKVLEGYHYSDFSQLYYVTQVTIMMFALIGIYSNSSCCLILMVVSESIILFIYLIMTMFELNVGLNEDKLKDSNAILLVITIFKYYLYLIILSFYHEVSHGRDGRGQGGIIITSGVTTTYAEPSSAASNPHPIVPSAPYADSPYAIQPPHAPIITQPCNSIYPSNEFPHVVIQTEITPCAPPPYPVPQPVVMNENPPPYAP